MGHYWKKKYSVGVPDIDVQHQTFFRLCERIDDFAEEYRVGKESDRSKLFALVLGLRTYLLQHFSSEEKLLKQLPFADYLEHCAQHDDFLREVLALVDQTKECYLGVLSGERGVGEYLELSLMISRMTREWSDGHLVKMDQKSFGMLLKKGEDLVLNIDSIDT